MVPSLPAILPWQAIEYAYDDRSGLYRKTKTTQVTPFVAAFARDEVVAQLRELLPCQCVHVKTSRELAAAATRPGALVFIEWDALCHVDPQVTRVPIVAIMDESAEMLPRLIRSFDAYPWLAHCVSSSLLQRAGTRAHLAMLVERLVMGTNPGMLGEARVARLARASHRDSRFERIRVFFADRGVTGRTIDRISEVYEELVTNALYDAPLEAGYFKKSIARTSDVDLPADRACEISYGIDHDTAYVRVRDTFGALTRARMVEVLTRCNTTGVEIDDSRGGAGLGLWRVFSAASSVVVTVDPGRVTEVMIGIATKEKRASRPAAVDLFFAPSAVARLRMADDDEESLIDHSITLIRVA
jgi:hypothetical protein